MDILTGSNLYAEIPDAQEVRAFLLF